MVNHKIIRAGVLGWPVNHSLSPRLHGYWLQKYAINGSYEPIAVEPENLEKTLRSLSRNGFAGVNVTVPHKEAIMVHLDKVDGLARRIGAVNTIIVESDESLTGSNTDGFGFLQNLKTHLPHWTAQKGPAVVIGAGGAARAICTALVEEGVPELRLVNRTASRAEILAKEIGGPINVSPWEEKADCLVNAALLVNTTTLGMVGKPPLDFDIARLPPEAVVNDIVYAPLETCLLKDAGKRGNPTVDGLGMLLHQARPGFSAWFKMEPQVTPDMRDFVLRGLD